MAGPARLRRSRRSGRASPARHSRRSGRASRQAQAPQWQGQPTQQMPPAPQAPPPPQWQQPQTPPPPQTPPAQAQPPAQDWQGQPTQQIPPQEPPADGQRRARTRPPDLNRPRPTPRASGAACARPTRAGMIGGAARDRSHGRRGSTMIIIVGYTPTPAGEAALDHGIAEAHHHGDDLLVVNVSGHSDPPKGTFATDTEIKDLEDRLRAEGVRFTVRQLVRGKRSSRGDPRAGEGPARPGHRHRRPAPQPGRQADPRVDRAARSCSGPPAR